MEDNNNIDDIFRSALENHEMEPSEKSWNSLSSDLARKRTSRLILRRLYYFIIPAVVLLVSFSAYKYFSSVNTNNEKIQNVTSLSDAKENSTQKINNNQPAEIKQDKLSQNNNALPESKSNPTENSNPSTLTADNGSSGVSLSMHKNENHTASTISEKNKNNSGTVTNESTIPEKNASEIITDKNTVTENQKVNPSNSVKSKNKAKSAVAAAASASAVTSANEPKSVDQVLKQSENSSSPVNSNEVNENEIAKNENQTIYNKEEINNSSQDANANNNSPVLSPELKAAAAGVILSENNAANASAPVSQTNETTPNTSQQNQNTPAADSTSAALNVKPEEKISDYQAAQKPDSNPSLLKKIYSHISVGVYYAPIFIKQNISVNDSYTGSASKNLDDYDDASSQYSYAAGFNLNYDIGKKWNIGSGASFSSYSISSVYNSINVISDSAYQEEYVNAHENNNGQGNQGSSHGHGHGHHNSGHGHHQPTNHHNNHHYIVHTPCGDIDLTTEPPQGTTADEGDTLSVKSEIFETVHYISIPLVVQYKFGQKKLSYFIEGGGSINFVNRDRVKVVINDTYTEDNNLNNLSSYYYGVQLGFGAQYNFYKGISAFLKPSVSYSVTTINIDSPVNSSPYFFGIGAGFTIHF